MARSTPVTATISAEILVELSGVFQPGYPERGPTYDCGGEPPEPDCVEDIAVTGLTVEVGRRADMHVVDLMAGVNPRCPDVMRLLDNIANALGEEALEALMEDASE